MLDLFSRRIDPKLSEDGVWIPFEDGKLKIARWDNRNYQRVLQGIAAKTRSEGSEATDLMLTDYAYDLIAQSILRDWQDVSFQADGTSTVYSADIGKIALAEVPELCEFVIREARKQSYYLRSAGESQLKN